MDAAPPIPGIVMIDDNAMAAEAMQRRFASSSELRWLGWTPDPAAVAALVQRERPALILLDVEMPGVDTFAILRQLAGDFPACAVVMFSGHDRPLLIDRALNDGAAGYIHKDEPTALIVELLVRASKGECVLSPLVSRVYMRAPTDAN